MVGRNLGDEKKIIDSMNSGWSFKAMRWWSSRFSSQFFFLYFRCCWLLHESSSICRIDFAVVELLLLLNCVFVDCDFMNENLKIFSVGTRIVS